MNFVDCEGDVDTQTQARLRLLDFALTYPIFGLPALKTKGWSLALLSHEGGVYSPFDAEPFFIDVFTAIGLPGIVEPNPASAFPIIPWGQMEPNPREDLPEEPPK